MKITWSTICIFLLFSTNAPAQTLTLGTLFELKGANAPTAQEAMNGAILAVKKINDSTSKIKIKLHMESATTDPETVIEAANKLKAVKSITAVTGTISSSAALSAASALQTASLTFLCSGAQVDNLAEATGLSTFTLAVPDIRVGQLLAEYTTNTVQAQNIVLIRSDLTDSDARQADSFARRFKQNNGKIMAELRITQRNSDLSFIADKINALKPAPPASSKVTGEVGADSFDDAGAAIISQKRSMQPTPQEIEAIIIFAPPHIAAKVMEEFKEKDISYQIIGGTSFDYVTMQQTLNNWPGSIVFASQASLIRENPLVQSFVKAYSILFGAAPSTGYAALGFDSIMLLAAAAEKNGIDTTQIQSSLSATKDFDGISGKISFHGRSAHKPLYIIQMESGSRTLATELD